MSPGLVIRIIQCLRNKAATKRKAAIMNLLLTSALEELHLSVVQQAFWAQTWPLLAPKVRSVLTEKRDVSAQPCCLVASVASGADLPQVLIVY